MAKQIKKSQAKVLDKKKKVIEKKRRHPLRWVKIYTNGSISNCYF